MPCLPVLRNTITTNYMATFSAAESKKAHHLQSLTDFPRRKFGSRTARVKSRHRPSVCNVKRPPPEAAFIDEVTGVKGNALPTCSSAVGRPVLLDLQCRVTDPETLRQRFAGVDEEGVIEPCSSRRGSARSRLCRSSHRQDMQIVDFGHAGQRPQTTFYFRAVNIFRNGHRAKAGRFAEQTPRAPHDQSRDD